MTQTWTGRKDAWLLYVIVACCVAAITVLIWLAFAFITPASFSGRGATIGPATIRVIAVAICLLLAFLLTRMAIAYVPSTVTLGEDTVTVRHGWTERGIRLADIDAVMYVATSVQSGAGLFIYPREQYLLATNSRVEYGHADPALTIPLQRFTDHDERAVVLALRDAVKAAGGRFGTSAGPAETDPQPNVPLGPSGRPLVARPTRTARPVVRKGA